MTQIYEARRKGGKAPAAGKSQTDIPGPSIGELAAGARPSAEQMGRRVDLPEAVREKMENAFGADFSSVRLYESDTVARAGAKAMTRGNSIAFAPGQLDLVSTAGQAALGHELSHVVSQARGESAGRGFLNDPRLEAQADRQGMLAAQGGRAYEGSVTPIGASSAAPVSGPMQAIKIDKDIAAATENRKVEFGKGGDLTGRIRDAKARQEDSRRLNSSNRQGAVYNSATFSNMATENDGDLAGAYQNRWNAYNNSIPDSDADKPERTWSFDKLLEGAASQHLREDEGGLGLSVGGVRGGEDRIYSNEEARRRYQEDHPEDIMSAYDRSMLEGFSSVHQLQKEWKRRGIK